MTDRREFRVYVTEGRRSEGPWAVPVERIPYFRSDPSEAYATEERREVVLLDSNREVLESLIQKNAAISSMTIPEHGLYYRVRTLVSGQGLREHPLPTEGENLYAEGFLGEAALYGRITSIFDFKMERVEQTV